MFLFSCPHRGEINVSIPSPFRGRIRVGVDKAMSRIFEMDFNSMVLSGFIQSFLKESLNNFFNGNQRCSSQRIQSV